MPPAQTVLLRVFPDRIGLTLLLGVATHGLRDRCARHDTDRVPVDVAVATADAASG